MRKHVFRMLIVSLVFLSGCWGIEEAERMDYVHGIGIDYEDGQVVVSLQIVNLANTGKSDTGGSVGGTQAVIAKEKGNTVNDAIFKIYRSNQRMLFWGHVTFIVVTKEAMKHNKMKDVIDLLNRYRETRYRIMVLATEDKDLDKIFEVTPIFEGSPVYTRVTDLNNTYKQYSWIKQRTMREILLQLKEPGYNAIIPAVTTTEKVWKSAEKPETMIEAAGVALTNKERFKGFVTGDDVNGLRWLTKEAVRNNVEVNKEDETIAEAVIIRPSFSVKPNVKDDNVTFHIHVKGTALFNELIRNEEHDFLKKEIDKKIKEEIKHTFNKALELDSDIYRLSEVLYRKNASTWKKITDNGKLPLNEDSIKVTVDIDIGASKIENERPVIK